MEITDPRNICRSIGIAIYDIINADDSDDTYYGLRVLPENSTVKVGDKLTASFKWIDNERTNAKLPGVSTIGIKKSISDTQTRLEITNAMRRVIRQGYQGDNVLLVRGAFVKEGSDPGEVLLRKPEVLHIFPKFDMEGEQGEH